MSECSTSVEKCRVVIIGAGASGLYCAHLLANQRVDDVVVLESRDRIGGRIHSVEHEFTSMPGETKSVAVDNGAAWVHGTGYDWNEFENQADIPESVPESNPMMDLLLKAKGVPDLYSNHLKPVCKRGNPWIRPKYVLHDDNNIVLYVAGNRLAKDDPVIKKSIARHFQLLQMVSDYGNQLYKEGRGMDTVYQSLQDTVVLVKSSLPAERQQESDPVEALTSWYQYLMEAWYGGQASDMQLLEFTRDVHEKLWRDEHYSEEGDFYGPHCTLRDGMKTVLEPLLADGGAARVWCKQEVVRIEETINNTVMLETKAGLTVEADCCVVTLPVGCLKDAVENCSLFQPMLSDEKIEVRRV